MANNNINLFERYWYDAMANFGQSLGQRSADNAARRQGIKSRNAIDEMLENSQRQQQIEEIANMNQPQPQKAVSVTGNIPGYNGFDLKRGTVLDPQFSLSSATPDGRSVQENAVDEVLNLKRMGSYPITGMSGNIDLEKRPVVKNPDGTVSTVSSMSFNEDGKEILIPTITADGKPMTEQQAIDYYHTTGQNLGSFNTVDEANAAAERIHKSEERRVRALGQDGSANAPAAKLGQEASGLSPQKAKLGWANVTADDVRNDLRKRGIDEDIIDKEIEYFKDQIKTKARDQFLPEIMDGLYGYTNKEGQYVAPSLESYRNANEKLMLLRTYDPETANPLLSGSITPRDIYNQNRADTVYGRTRQDLLTDKAEARSNKKQDVQESFALKRDAEKQQFLDQVQLFMEVYDVDYKTAAKLALGGSGTGRGKGGSGLPGSVSTQQMNAAKEEIKAFDNWREMNPDVDVKTYPRYNQLNFAYQINDAALGYGGNGGSNTSFDWNDRNAVVAKAQEAIADGQSWESVLSIAKENMVDGETYRELERLAKQNEGTADNTASKQQNYADEYLANVEKEKLAQEQYNYGQLRNQAARAGLYVDTRGKVWPMNPSYFNPNSDDGKVKVELYNQWAAANGLPAWGQ